MRRVLPVVVVLLLIGALVTALLVPASEPDGAVVPERGAGAETKTVPQPRNRVRTAQKAAAAPEEAATAEPSRQPPAEPTAVAWLLARQQADGSWAPRAGDDATRTELTAVVTLALLAAPNPDEDSTAALEKALAWLRARIGEDGRITDPERGPHRRSHAMATLALIEAAGLSGKLEDQQLTSMPLTHLLADLGGPAFNREGSDRDSEAELAAWSAMAVRSGAMVMGESIFEESFGRLLKRGRNNIHGFFGDSSDVAFGDRSVAMLTCAEILLGSDPSNDGRVQRGVNALLERTEEGELESDPRLAYFGTMVTFQKGGKAWQTWRGRLAATPRPARNKDGNAYEVAAWALADTIVDRYSRAFGHSK